MLTGRLVNKHPHHSWRNTTSLMEVLSGGFMTINCISSDATPTARARQSIGRGCRLTLQAQRST